MITKKDIVKYYIAMFDRIPEKEAVESWYNQAIENDLDESKLASALFNAAVNVVNSNDSLKEIYPQYVNFNENNLLSIMQVIESVYKSLFNKDLNDDYNGILHWSVEIYNKKITLPDAIVSIEHFTDDVYHHKIDLNELGYSQEETQEINNDVNTFENRVDFAYKLSNVIENIKIDNKSLKILEESVSIVHTQEDYKKACEFLEENLDNVLADTSNIPIVIEEINNLCENDNSDDMNYLLDIGENISFIDLPMQSSDANQIEIHSDILL